MDILNKANFVDLGLPSGILWSKKPIHSYNAMTAMNYGDFGAIGDNKKNIIQKIIDGEMKNYLPTIEYIEELRNNCTIKEYRKDWNLFIIRSKINKNYLILYGGYYLLNEPKDSQNFGEIDDLLVFHQPIFIETDFKFKKPVSNITPFFIRLIKRNK